MNNLPPAVSELPPNGAALIEYPEYRKKNPPPEDGESKDSVGLRVLILPPLGAARVIYSQFDVIVFLSGRLPNRDGTGDEAEAEELAATTYPELRRKES